MLAAVHGHEGIEHGRSPWPSTMGRGSRPVLVRERCFSQVGTQGKAVWLNNPLLVELDVATASPTVEPVPLGVGRKRQAARARCVDAGGRRRRSIEI